MGDLLSRMDVKLDDIAERMSKVEGQFEQNEKHIRNFYGQNIAPLIAKIGELDIDIARLKTTIAIWGTGGVIIVSGLISFFIKNL